MLRYIGIRLLQAVPMLLLISAVTFLLIQLAPYNVIDAITTPNMSDQTREIMAERYGLNDPLHVQYWNWLTNILQGDFGYSLASRRDIAGEMGARIPNTIILVVPAYITALIIAIVLGLVAGANKGRWVDRFIDSLNSIGLATPTFWFALIVIYLFGYYLRWFPIIGMHTVGREGDPIDFLQHFAMPYLVLTVAFFPDLARYVRASTIGQLDSDYVLVQRAFGASRREIFSRHVSRNVLLPIVTQAGMSLPLLVTGAVITETIFGWPGIGQYLLTATRSMDYPVILALLLLSGTLVILGNLLADVMYYVIDPRIRLQGSVA